MYVGMRVPRQALADYTVSHTDLAQNLFLLSRATQ